MTTNSSVIVPLYVGSDRSMYRYEFVVATCRETKNASMTPTMMAVTDVFLRPKSFGSSGTMEFDMRNDRLQFTNETNG